MSEKKASGCGFIVFLVALLGLVVFTFTIFWIYGSLGASLVKTLSEMEGPKELKQFSTEVWTSPYLDSHKSKRADMLPDLIYAHLEDGMSKSDVLELCGPTDREAQDTLVYFVGPTITLDGQQVSREFKLEFRGDKMAGVWLPQLPLSTVQQ